MAKLGGQGARVPPTGNIRPQARPAVPQGGASAGGLPGFFPQQGSKAQYDMIMQLVQAGMSNAQQSGSPIAALLAPLAGAAIGGGATRKYQDAQAKSQSELAQSVLGDAASNPNVKGYIDVLNDPNAPGYLKTIAQSRLNAAINPAKGRTGRTTARRTGGGRGTAKKVSGQAQSRLFGEYDIGGVLHGRDKFGKMVPYTGPDGSPVPSSRKPNTAAPASVVDELTSLTTPAPTGNAAAVTAPRVDEADPLGILGLPPA